MFFVLSYTFSFSPLTLVTYLVVFAQLTAGGVLETAGAFDVSFGVSPFGVSFELTTISCVYPQDTLGFFLFSKWA